MPGGTAVLQGAGGVLEELVAPQVEHAGLDAVLFADGRNLDLFDEVLPDDGGLLVGGEMASLGRAHDSPSPPEFGGGWSHVSTDPVQWEREHGPLPAGHRLFPKIPFVCGGEFTSSNLASCSDVDSMRFRGALARQIRDLEDGKMIVLRVTE